MDLVVVRAVVDAGVRPLVPVADRVLERLLGVDLVGQRLMRRVPREDERDAVAGRERELRDGRQVLAVQLDRRAEAERVGAGDRDPRVVDAAHPRHDLAVVEADHELRAHRHDPLDALDDPHDVRGLAARRHEVDRADDALGGLVGRLEHERVVPVCAGARASAARRARAASGRGRASRAAPRSRRPSRSAGSSTSRSTPRGRPARRSAGRRSARSPRSAPRAHRRKRVAPVSDRRTPALPRRLRPRRRPRRRRARTSGEEAELGHRPGEQRDAPLRDRRASAECAADQRVELLRRGLDDEVRLVGRQLHRRERAARTRREIVSPSTKRISYAPSTAASGRKRTWTAYMLQQSPAAGEPSVRRPMRERAQHGVERAPSLGQLVDRDGPRRRQLRLPDDARLLEVAEAVARMFVPIPGSASARSV